MCKEKFTLSSLFWYTLYILNSMFVKTDVNLPNKTVFANKNWKQSLTDHIVEHKGWSKLCVDIILATLYISLCDHPICWTNHSLKCVWNMNPVGLFLFTRWHFKDYQFFTILCVTLWALPPPAHPLTHFTHWVVSLIIHTILIWNFPYLKENKISYEMTPNFL